MKIDHFSILTGLVKVSVVTNVANLGLIHTRHNIAIKRYFWAMDFKTNQGKLLTKHKVPWFVSQQFTKETKRRWDTKCQFHQRYTYEFFVRASIWQLFSS